MRSHVEFRSAALLAEDDAGEAPAGETLARLLARGLPGHGYAVRDVLAEDWGWCVRLFHDAFPLWIGCGRYEEHDDGWLCFVEPSRPFVRRRLRRVPTGEVTGPLAAAVERLLLADARVSALRWWTQAEVDAGLR